MMHRDGPKGRRWDIGQPLSGALRCEGGYKILSLSVVEPLHGCWLVIAIQRGSTRSERMRSTIMPTIVSVIQFITTGMNFFLMLEHLHR